MQFNTWLSIWVLHTDYMTSLQPTQVQCIGYTRACNNSATVNTSSTLVIKLYLVATWRYTHAPNNTADAMLLYLYRSHAKLEELGSGLRTRLNHELVKACELVVCFKKTLSIVRKRCRDQICQNVDLCFHASSLPCLHTSLGFHPYIFLHLFTVVVQYCSGQAYTVYLAVQLI